MTLRLRCARCGAYDEMDPMDLYLRALCWGCIQKHPMPLSSPRAERWMARWQKGMESHPTYKALTAALEALEPVPYGTLALPSEPT